MVVCSQCGKEVKVLSRHLWRSHGPGLNHKPMSGKKHTDEARNLVRLARLGKSSGMKGRKSSFTAHTQKTKDQIAAKMKGNNNAKHRGDRQSYHNGIRMDSSWEVKVAEYLDAQGLQWEYGQKVFSLSERKSYRPDFVLACGKIIEVKGYWRKENKEKFELWRSLYPDVVCEVWDKTKLKELKIL